MIGNTKLNNSTQSPSLNRGLPPIVWGQDYWQARELNSSLVTAYAFSEAKDEIPAGHHYILAEPTFLEKPGTSEAMVKALAWRIQAAGYSCEIYQCQQPLSALLDGEAITAREMTGQILGYSIPFEEWRRSRDEASLKVREALDIAKVVIRLCPRDEKDTELATLQERCGKKDWEWNKLMGKLEKEFRRELEQRGLTILQDEEDEKLRLSLLALLKEADPIKRLRKRAEICSHHRIKAVDVEQALKHLQRDTSTPQSKCYSLDDVFDLEIEGLSWVIPELLPKGESIILAGSPKAGKTLLAIDAAFAIATGESGFLGEASKRGKVLLVSTDESLSSTKNKLVKRGFRRQDRDYIQVIPQWTIDQMDVLEKKLEDWRPDVVIIDSLRRISHGSQISENSAEFADNIYTLKETIGRYGASGILIHHTNKNPDAMGVGKLRGSSAIAGAVWGTWQLDHIPKEDPNNKKRQIIDPKDPVRILSIFARDTEGQTLKIEFNPENNSWARLDSDEQDESLTVRQRILNVLGLNIHACGMSGAGIIEALGMSREEGRGVYTELNRMVGKRLINCKPAPGDKRYNLYSLPKTGDTPPPTPCEQIVEYSDETLTVQELDNTQQIVNNYSTDSQQPTSNMMAVDYLNPVRETVSEILNNLPTERGGEGVHTDPETGEIFVPSDEEVIVTAPATAPQSEAIATLAPSGQIAPAPQEEAPTPTPEGLPGWEIVPVKAPVPPSPVPTIEQLKPGTRIRLHQTGQTGTVEGITFGTRKPHVVLVLDEMLRGKPKRIDACPIGALELLGDGNNA